LQRNEPRAWEQAKQVHTAVSYLVLRLTGCSVLDYAGAGGFTPLFNLHQRQWDVGMCAKLGVSPNILPKLRWATHPAGAVHARVARETGLAEGTIVITGTGDTYAEVVSVGAAQEGDAGLIYGTTMSMMAMLGQPRADRKLSYGYAAVPDMYRVGFAMSASGALTRWFRDNFGQAEKGAEASVGISAYQLLSQEATGIPPGSEGLLVLPYFAGERAPIHDPAARGLILGLTLSHSRQHIYRALLEGIAFGLRHCLEELQDAGVVIHRIVGTGGGTRNSLWTQIVSDVIGQDQQIVTSPYGAPMGGAFLAGYGAGLFRDLTPLRTDWVQSTSTVRWNPAAKRLYDRYFQVYRGLYAELADDMHALAALSQEGRR
jgi:xylulokinase